MISPLFATFWYLAGPWKCLKGTDGGCPWGGAKTCLTVQSLNLWHHKGKTVELSVSLHYCELCVGLIFEAELNTFILHVAAVFFQRHALAQLPPCHKKFFLCSVRSKFKKKRFSSFFRPPAPQRWQALRLISANKPQRWESRVVSQWLRQRRHGGASR